jgi:ATP-dependent RNA helicase DDX24/MAK5
MQTVYNHNADSVRLFPLCVDSLIFLLPFPSFIRQISSGDQEHLKDLSQIQFLVLDEADRMTQDHSFPELVQLLERIHHANPGQDDDQDEEEPSDADDEDDQQDRLLGLPGIRGEAALTMLTPELLQQIQDQRQSTRPPDSKETPEEEFPDKEQQSEEEDDDEEDLDEVFNVATHNADDDDASSAVTVHRQTFIYSATLTLPFTSTKAASSSNKKSSRRPKRKIPLEGGLAEILEKTHAMGETKVVDLSSASNNNETNSSGFSENGNKKGVQFPPGLTFQQIKW